MLTLARESQSTLVAKVHRVDKALVAQVCEGVVVDVEVVLGHDPEGADGGQRAAVLAVQFVDSVTVYHQLALLAARQVKVMHQAVVRFEVVPVAVVVHARALVAALPLAVVARTTPSSIRHRPSLVGCWLFGFVREDALTVAARGRSGEPEALRRVAVAWRALVMQGPRLVVCDRPSRGFGPRT